MALGTCQECRKGMSDSADSCPHCGSTRRPVKSVKRKKIVAVNCAQCGGEGVMYSISYESNHCLPRRGLGFPSGWMGWRDAGSRSAKREDVEKVKKEILNQAEHTIRIRISRVSEVPCGCRGKKEAEIEFFEEVEFD